MAGSTTARGYGSEHQKLRAQWAPRVARGEVHCARCGELIGPDDPWDLGHDDDAGDRRVYWGPEHRFCNRRTAAHRAEREQSLRSPRLTSRDW